MLKAMRVNVRAAVQASVVFTKLVIRKGTAPKGNKPAYMVILYSTVALTGNMSSREEVCSPQSSALQLNLDCTIP